jgi:hypothetical protein
MISQTVRNKCVRFGGHIDIEVSYKILQLDVLKESPILDTGMARWMASWAENPTAVERSWSGVELGIPVMACATKQINSTAGDPTLGQPRLEFGVSLVQ